MKNTRMSDLAQKVGLLFLNPENQIFMFSVERDIAFGLESLGMPADEIRTRVLAAQRVAKRRGWGVGTLIAASTTLGVLTRTSIMTVVNAIILPLPYPIGFGTFGVTVSQLPALLPLIGLFNFTVALYTIPLAHSMQRAIAARYRLNTLHSSP